MFQFLSRVGWTAGSATRDPGCFRHAAIQSTQVPGFNRRYAETNCGLQSCSTRNVRQLSHVCSCLVTHAAAGAWIGVDDVRRHCPDVLSGPRNPNPEAYLESEDATYAEALRGFRKRLILDRLRRHGDSAVEAAASLKISGPTFYRYWQDARRFP